MLDRRLVALQRPSRGAPAGEVERDQDAPYVALAVRTRKAPLDQPGHARQRPQIGRETLGQRPAGEGAHQLAPLRRIQAHRPAARPTLERIQSARVQ